MAKVKDKRAFKYATCLGGPFSYKIYCANGCVKTNKILADNFIGCYARHDPSDEYIQWQDSEKIWYYVKNQMTQKELKKLGIWATCGKNIEYSEDGKGCYKIGIDKESNTHIIFELRYSEDIIKIFETIN